MSTRSNVCIIGDDGAVKLYLYRHCDGYPAEAGATALEVVKQINGHPYVDNLITWSDVANEFLSKFYDATEYRKQEPIYKVTECFHGDIEFAYFVRRFADGWRVAVVSTRWDAADDPIEPAEYPTLTEFAALVNKERRLMNARSKAQGGTGSYEMVTV